MTGPWRLRCPAGHSNLQVKSGDGYYCKTRSETYSGDPVDPKGVDSWECAQTGDDQHPHSVQFRILGDVDA